MGNNHFAKAVNEITKRAHQNAARCILIWAALALREEGYGKERMKRVLDNIVKYSQQSISGTDIEEQMRHVERITGLRFVFTSENSITVEEIADLEQYDDV